MNDEIIKNQQKKIIEAIEETFAIISLEEENKIDEEHIDSPKVRIGYLYEIEGLEWRVFQIREQTVAAISMTTDEIRKIPIVSFIESVEDGIYIKIESTPEPSYELTSEELEVVRKRADVFEKILDENFENCEHLFRRGKKKGYVEQAILLGISDRSWRRYFKKYLRSGRDKLSLIDGRKENSRPQKVYAKDYENPVNDIDEMLRYGLQMYHILGNAKKAHKEVIAKFFRIPEEQPDGSVKLVSIPKEQWTVTYKMLLNYIKKHNGGLSLEEMQMDPKERQNNGRQKTGTSTTGVYHLGQIAEADEMELGCYCVDHDLQAVVGKPIIYGILDLKSGMTLSVYTSLENNSMRGFQQVFLGLLEPHYKQTAGYDIKFSEDEWPSLIVPEEIRCDRGAEYMSKAYGKAMAEMNIRYSAVPPGVGSLKGVVECFNGLVQKYLLAHLKENGKIEKTYRGGDIAKGQACLTIEEIRGFVYKAVLLANKRVFEKTIDKKYLLAGVSPTPQGIFQYEKEHHGDPTNVSDENRAKLLFMMLAKEDDKRSIRWDRKKGIVYTFYKRELCFYLHETWFENMLKDEKNLEDIEIRYNTDDISCVFIRYKNKIRRIPLGEKREEQDSYSNDTWDEYDDLIRAYNSSDIVEKARKDFLDEELRLGDDVKKTVDMAHALNPMKEQKSKYGKAHPEDKTAKKLQMRKDPNEIIARSYASIDPSPEQEEIICQIESVEDVPQIEQKKKPVSAIEMLMVPKEDKEPYNHHVPTKEEQKDRILQMLGEEDDY